ncbi:unnamed protein product [Kuraishia capsulata CBS 1993]|uniref:CDC45-like protein n=1 Tax=Kuraishia capsulata CBS 1993 TaxID=1382522 RepID=W6MRI9_9ASCO|nr:uncharacterized protein KUCA_T00003841001 [Kuraishia capsulata CBS 1993]CDK27862.1 unnamed protein product [Kuraishia capsulata CBS 1993]
MYLIPTEFAKAFQAIKQTSLSHSTCKVVIFASCLSIDAICASRMLSILFKKNLIAYQLIPVVGYADLKKKFSALDADVSNVIFLGCGGMIDVESYLEIDPQQLVDAESVVYDENGQTSFRFTRQVYIIDGHRPWNLDNLFGSKIITCFDDGGVDTNLENERAAYDVLVSIGSDDEGEDEEGEESEDGGDEEEDANSDTDDDDELDGSQESRKRRKSGNGKISKKRMVTSNEKVIDAYYNQGTTITTPVTLQVYSMLSTIGETSLEYLWFTIIGTTSLNSQYSALYDRCLPLLKDEVKRLENNSSASTGFVSGSKKSADSTNVTIDKDYSLFLLRHWNLYNSFFYSSYVNSKLQLYTAEGKKKLNTLFARMGISLTSAYQNWYYVDVDLKRKLPDMLAQHLQKYDYVIRDGFLRNYGYHGSVSASEFVESVTALLEYDAGEEEEEMEKRRRGGTSNGATEEPDKDIDQLIARRESQYVVNFWKSFDALADFKAIQRGLQIAKWQQKFVFDKGLEIFQKKMIKDLRVFRLVVLKGDFASGASISDTAKDGKGHDQIDAAIEIRTMGASKVFRNPLMLTKLGNWILDSCMEIDASALPLIIASLDTETDTYLVCGLPPKHRTSAEEADNIAMLNTFSLAFQEVANTTSTKARIDSFESSIIEIAKEDLQSFLERLTLSGLV